MQKFTQRHKRQEQKRSFDRSHDDCENDICVCIQFLWKQIIQLTDLPERFESHSFVLPVFGFKSAKYALNSNKYYLLPFLVSERGIEPTTF